MFRKTHMILDILNSKKYKHAREGHTRWKMSCLLSKLTNQFYTTDILNFSFLELVRWNQNLTVFFWIHDQCFYFQDMKLNVPKCNAQIILKSDGTCKQNSNFPHSNHTNHEAKYNDMLRRKGMRDDCKKIKEIGPTTSGDVLSQKIFNQHVIK